MLTPRKNLNGGGKALAALLQAGAVIDAHAKRAREVWDRGVDGNGRNFNYLGFLTLEIEYYLKSRIGNPERHLDIGGGGIAYLPEATVLDGSKIALGRNESPKRLCFDLSKLSTSPLSTRDIQHLPFADGSFETASMVSVYQYLSNDVLLALFREMRRVLIPRGSLYIIHPKHGRRDAGYEAHFADRGRPDIEENLRRLLDTLGLPYRLSIENITLTHIHDLRSFIVTFSTDDDHA